MQSGWWIQRPRIKGRTKNNEPTTSLYRWNLPPNHSKTLVDGGRGHWGVHRNSSHQSERHWWQSAACLELACAVSLSQSTNSSLFFFSTRNWPSTTDAWWKRNVKSFYRTESPTGGALALSKPFLVSRWPRTSPMPARSVTSLSPIGSATKLRCFCDVDDMVLVL